MRFKIWFAAVLSMILILPVEGSECLAATEKAPQNEGFCLIDVKDIPRMAVAELKSRLNDPSLIIIDVRAPVDWKAGSTKIKGAFREVLENVDEWPSKYKKDKAIVLYCS